MEKQKVIEQFYDVIYPQLETHTPIKNTVSTKVLAKEFAKFAYEYPMGLEKEIPESFSFSDWIVYNAKMYHCAKEFRQRPICCIVNALCDYYTENLTKDTV